VEMDNSSMELVNYFITTPGRRKEVSHGLQAKSRFHDVVAERHPMADICWCCDCRMLIVGIVTSPRSPMALGRHRVDTRCRQSTTPA